MPRVLVIGGGLAGLSAAAALGEAGYAVEILEARSYLGGRATSYPVPGGDQVIDNCQHVLLGCCTNLLDFYDRLGVADKIAFHHRYFFLEPGGRINTLVANDWPPPLHFALSFPWMRCFSWAEKVAISRGLLAIRREYRERTDLDTITMAEWLQEQRQPPRAVERFWRQVLVSAINEEPDRMAASHAFQVFWLGFLAGSEGCAMGVPSVPLGELYGEQLWKAIPNVQLRMRTPIERLVQGGAVSAGETFRADAYVLAVPFDRAETVAPELGLDFSRWQHSPITGIHLWFDRPVTRLPHATLLDRTIQWLFNKHEGRYLQLVVSASRSLVEMPRNEVIELALRELGEFLPAVRAAQLEQAHVVKELKATFSARPGLNAERPGSKTAIPNIFLAGDYIRTGWPATMEGAVRGGYLAAEAVTEYLGQPRKFVVADIA